MRLPDEFQNRMRKELGSAYDEFYRALVEDPPARALRVNTLKIGADKLRAVFPYELEPSGILAEGFILSGDGEGVSRHPYHAAGLYYLQEPSAMNAVAAMDIRGGMRILDMCAAPGGKTTAIAARMGSAGMLVANEVVPSRARALYSNIERMGVTNCAVISARPDDIAHKLPCYFDAVLVDAPCSGEGMFRKDSRAIEEWSSEHVRSCAARQLPILECAAETLSVGGELVYSTCTFSRDENEGVIERFIEKHPNYILKSSNRFYPHQSVGEGHFVAKLVKVDSQSSGAKEPQRRPKSLMRDSRQAMAAMLGFLKDNFLSVPDGEPLFLEDGRAYLSKAELIDVTSRFFTLCSGVFAGEYKSGRFVPSHALYMAAYNADFKNMLSFAADSREVADFLRGFTLEVDVSDGIYAFCVDGYALGHGKVSRGILKNALPKGLRIMK